MVRAETIEHEINLSQLEIIKDYFMDNGCENMANALNWIMLDYRVLMGEFAELKYSDDD